MFPSAYSTHSHSHKDERIETHRPIFACAFQSIPHWNITSETLKVGVESDQKWTHGCKRSGEDTMVANYKKKYKNRNTLFNWKLK